MPHELLIAGERRPLVDDVTIGRGDIGPALRVHRTASGDAVVIAAVEATRDGAPILGNLAFVPWGAGAILRTGDLKVEIVWQAQIERCVAGPGRRCRICFGAIAAEENAVVCPCGVFSHEECHAVSVDCAACGAAHMEET